MDKNVILRPVLPDEYSTVRRLAETIWPVCYKDILSQAQIAYMMDMMYAEKVIAAEVAAGSHYFFIECGGETAGFLAWGPLQDLPGAAKLHKLYLLPAKQGQGIGSMSIELVKQQANSAGFSRLRLNVNRQNSNAIKCYQKKGFATVTQENNDIGSGFFMTDFVMETEV